MDAFAVIQKMNCLVDANCCPRPFAVNLSQLCSAILENSAFLAEFLPLFVSFVYFCVMLLVAACRTASLQRYAEESRIFGKILQLQFLLSSLYSCILSAASVYSC